MDNDRQSDYLAWWKTWKASNCHNFRYITYARKWKDKEIQLKNPRFLQRYEFKSIKKSKHDSPNKKSNSNFLQKFDDPIGMNSLSAK